MTAPTPDTKEISFKENDTMYYIQLKVTVEYLEITIQKDSTQFGKKYIGKFTLEELISKSKWFKMFDSIPEVFQEMNLSFENQKIKLKEESNYIGLLFVIPMRSKEEILLPIIEIESKKDIALSDLVSVVNNLSKRAFLLMNKFNVIEKTPEYQRLLKKKEAVRNGDILLKKDEESIIKKSIVVLQNENITFELIYKATIDGDTSEDFHSICDNRGSNVVIIKTTKGFIFGGYTSISWDKSNKYKTDANAFLFSISMKKIYLIKTISEAILCNDSAGPIFGSGHDIYITGDSFLSSNSNTCSLKTYSNGYWTEINGKESKFVVQELEVYQIISTK